MNYKLIITIMILSVVILTGQGCKGECKLARECDDGNVCTKDSCLNKKCIHSMLPDCHTGDGVCDREEGENECTAPQDCGLCTGENTKYLAYQCNVDKECVADIIGEVKEEAFSEIVTEGSGLSMAVTYRYDNPLNVDRSLFKIKIDLENSPATISDIKIKKIQLLEKEGTVTRILGDKDISKPLFAGVSVEDSVPLKIPTSDKEKEIQPTLKIIYEFLENKQTRRPASYEKVLSNKIILVDSTARRSCPSCDDNNDCTQDSCSEETDYFCENIPVKRSCCGNFICDDDENECTCPNDCGYCERDYGLYMRYRCSNYKCLPVIKDLGAIKPKTLVNDISFYGFQIQVKTTIDEPFNIKGSKIKADIEAKTINIGVQNIRCKKLQLIEGNELLGEADISITLASVGQASQAILTPNDFLRSAEESRNPNLKFSCEYDQGQQHVLAEQQINLGKITFISSE